VVDATGCVFSVAGLHPFFAMHLLAIPKATDLYVTSLEKGTVI
jgi:hypothetical protein